MRAEGSGVPVAAEEEAAAAAPPLPPLESGKSQFIVSFSRRRLKRLRGERARAEGAAPSLALP